jgi:hypothetical protein
MGGQYNIKMDLEVAYEYVEWIHLSKVASSAGLL